MTPEARFAALADAVLQAGKRRGLGGDPRWPALADLLDWWRAGSSDAHDAATQIDGMLARIAAVFDLDAMATGVLLAAAAPDIDPNIAAAYGMLLGADGPRPASVALALELAGISLLDGRGRAALGPAAPLCRWGLVRVQGGDWALGRAVVVGEGVIAALLGEPVDDAVAGALMVPDAGPEDVLTADGVSRLTAALGAGAGLAWVENPPGGAGASVARTAFAEADIRCVTADLALRPDSIALPEAAAALVRHAGLRCAGLILETAERLHADPRGAEAIRLLADAPIPVVLVGSARWNASWLRALPVIVRAAPLTPADRLDMWRRHTRLADIADADLTQYRLTPAQIDAVARHASDQAQVDGREVDALLVADGVRLLGGPAAVRGGLGWARATFADLQVPGETMSELQRFASWVHLRDTVTSGSAVQGLGGKGTGIAALFTGGPGTGKTLAAHVIADTAGLDLMQVDLSGVVDKYIGETEKNLERIFAEAENLNVVLFFDEADALFGKRSEGRDAHDRFANQEVAYLLQRMEQFDGVTILATNLRGNLDVAFARRLHFIVHFPDPEEETRERLWRGHLAQAGPMDADDPVDVPRLAAALQLSGGDIRNIVMSAVYDAAAAGRPVGMRQVAAAAVREYAKLGRRMPAGLDGT
jgi:hypothetical protein